MRLTAKTVAQISARSVMSLAPDPLEMDRALMELHRRGLETSIRGRLTASGGAGAPARSKCSCINIHSAFCAPADTISHPLATFFSDSSYH